jgi:hypothetical protein
MGPRPPSRREGSEGRGGVPAVVGGLALALAVPIALLVAILGITVAATPDGATLTGAPATVLTVMLLAVPVAFVVGALTAVVGATRILASRRRVDAEAHARLRGARDTARTSAEAARVQSTRVPGRWWRRRLRLTLTAGPLVLAFFVHQAGATTASQWLVAAAVPGALLLVRGAVVRRRAVRATFARQNLSYLGDDGDDEPALARREAAMTRFAAARNLAYAPRSAPRMWTSVQPRHCVSGTIDCLPFTLSDLVGHSTYSVSDGPVRTRITSAATTVAVPFPTVVALAVTPDTADAGLRWSHLGPQVQLESLDFNDTFDVFCDDPVRARLVLNPAVMARLLGWPTALELVLAGGELRLTAPDTFVPTDELDDFIGLAATIARSTRSALV